jgi:phage gp29-like protein
MIRNGAYGRIPANFELLFAEAKNALQNTESYMTVIHLLNDEMSKCINGQTLTAEASGNKGAGSRALGQVHQQTQSSRDIYRAEGLASTLNPSVVKWLVDFNFSGITGYPEFRFDLEEAEDLKSESEIIKNLAPYFDFDETELSEKFNYQLTKKKPLDLKPNPLDKKPDENNPSDKVDENGNLIDQNLEE